MIDTTLTPGIAADPVKAESSIEDPVTVAVRDEARLIVTVLANPFIPHQPTARQSAFLRCNEIEAFYGGAAGGGKSDALLMAALQYVDVPGYAALLLRRTYADLTLPEALMDRARSWLRGKARWYDQAKTWVFPSGATLSFGYLENEVDRYRYQSAAFQFIGIDELTQFAERSYLYLFSRLRRLEGSTVPLRMRSASNPGGVGHEWVRSRFVSASRDSKRPFFPARLEDNPHLDHDQYGESLSRLDHVTRRQLREGDWEAVVAGNLFLPEFWRYYAAQTYDVNGYVFLTADTAMKDKDTNDPSVIHVWNATPEYLDLVHEESGRWRFPELLRRSRDLWSHWSTRFNAQRFYVEDKSSGTPLCDMMAEYGIPVTPWRPKDYGFPEDKLGRAKMASWYVESGRVRLPDDAPQVTKPFIDEHARFGSEDAVHDDKVDAMTMAASVWRWKGALVALPVRRAS